MGRLGELARIFLKLGFVAFGGPAAHIAMMEEEFVVRRKWIERQHFLDLLGATNLIPGPNSTELAIHIGYRHAGWRGLMVAGSCFILPAMLIVMVFGWAYLRYGALPAAEGLLFGVKPVIIAIILYLLNRTELRTKAPNSLLLNLLGFITLLVTTFLAIRFVLVKLGG